MTLWLAVALQAAAVALLVLPPVASWIARPARYRPARAGSVSLPALAALARFVGDRLEEHRRPGWRRRVPVVRPADPWGR